MTVIETLRAKLRAMPQKQRRVIAEKAGIPFPTVQKFALGQAKDPRYSTASALLAILPHNE